MDAIQKIGINYQALAIYLVNFGILVAALGKFLYRPILDILDERRELIRKNLEEAEDLRESFSLELQKQQEKTDSLLTSMERDVLKAKTEAKKEAVTLLSEAEQERANILKDAHIYADKIKEAMHDEVAGEVLERVEKVVTSVLQNKVPESVVRHSVHEAWEKEYSKIK